MIVRKWHPAFQCWYWTEDGIDWYEEATRPAYHRGQWFEG